MVAWLLHLHGVWIGKGKVTQDPDSNPQVPTENTAIKQYLRDVRPGIEPALFREQMLVFVPEEGQWLVKTAQNLMRWPQWNAAWPNARWVLPHRPIEDCLASKARKFRRGDPVRERAATEHQFKLQADIVYQCNYVFQLDADAICGGGSDGLQEAKYLVEWLGLKFDPKIYEDWVQPERWNRK